jgi:hypothetical protein
LNIFIENLRRNPYKIHIVLIYELLLEHIYEKLKAQLVRAVDNTVEKTPERCPTLVGSGLLPKYKTGLESLAWSKTIAYLACSSVTKKKVLQPLLKMGCYLKMYCAIRGSQAWNSNDSRY